MKQEGAKCIKRRKPCPAGSEACSDRFSCGKGKKNRNKICCCPKPEPTTKPMTEPMTKPTTEPTTAPTTEPTTEPMTKPKTKPTTEPMTKPTTEPRPSVYFKQFFNIRGTQWICSSKYLFFTENFCWLGNLEN